ncbi:hypothetical protein Egran_04591 [Elaphomyces granulatus]|uniref:Uncharacterized protein n=1 Tax=Elaphomyces granulatus TaxID=519963 RepID=A0A232LU83_9EURO|nr:hypothetical protein Egran_04591 [Elaphomyces granulatus]
MTGTGKSTFVRRLSGKPVQIGHGLKSRKRVVAGGLSMSLVCSGRTLSHSSTLQASTIPLAAMPRSFRLAQWMEQSFVAVTLLSGVIYLYHITDIRMANTSMRNLALSRR